MAPLREEQGPHHMAHQVEVRGEQDQQQGAQTDQHVEQGGVDDGVARHLLINDCCSVHSRRAIAAAAFFIGSPIYAQAADHWRQNT